MTTPLLSTSIYLPAGFINNNILTHLFIAKQSDLLMVGNHWPTQYFNHFHFFLIRLRRRITGKHWKPPAVHKAAWCDNAGPDSSPTSSSLNPRVVCFCLYLPETFSNEMSSFLYPNLIYYSTTLTRHLLRPSKCTMQLINVNEQGLYFFSEVDAIESY